LHLISRFHRLRLSMEYLDVISGRLKTDRVPLFDDDASKFSMDFLDLTVTRRRHSAMRLHTMATVHVESPMRIRADTPASAEVTRRPCLVAAVRRLNQVHQALDHWINRHIMFSYCRGAASCADDIAPGARRIIPKDRAVRSLANEKSPSMAASQRRE